MIVYDASKIFLLRKKNLAKFCTPVITKYGLGYYIHNEILKSL